MVNYHFLRNYKLNILIVVTESRFMIIFLNLVLMMIMEQGQRAGGRQVGPFVHLFI